MHFIKFRFFFSLFTILNLLEGLHAQSFYERDTVRVSAFLLVSGKKSFRVDKDDYLELYYKSVGLGNDSVQRSINGFFAYCKGDSIGMAQFDVKDLLYFDDSLYLRKKQKLYTKLFLSDTVHFYCLSKVDRMVTENKTIERIMGVGFGAAVLSALVLSPILSVNHGHADWAKMGKITGFSALAGLGFMTCSLVYWPRKHELRQVKGSKRIYTIRKLYSQPWLND